MPPSQIRSGPGLVRQYAFEGASTPGAGGLGGPEPEDDKAAAGGSRRRGQSRGRALRGSDGLYRDQCLQQPYWESPPAKRGKIRTMPSRAPTRPAPPSELCAMKWGCMERS